MITLIKTLYEDLPESVRKAVINWDKKEIKIDETLLTPQELATLKNYFAQESFK